MKEPMLQQILENYPDGDFLKASGFDEAIIGAEEKTMRLIYSVKKCMDILMEDDMNELDALEYFSYNMEGSYIGEKTPIWCNDLI
jgi:hypothetical protein